MKMKRSLLALVLAAAIFAAGAATGAAASTIAPITAYLDYGATVELNGVPQDFLDANGNRVYIISYNGATYLPIRKMAELFDLDVGWDDATHTVQLGNTKDVDLIDDIGAYFLTADSNSVKAEQHQSSEGNSQTISGIECANYLRLHLAGYGHWVYVGTKARASFNLGGKYESVTFKCYCPEDTILRVYFDNNTLQKEITISAGQVAQEITLPLFGTNELTFEAEKLKDNRTDTDVDIFNATVKPIQN